MKPLSVKKYARGGYWTITATRVGKPQRFGNFKTEAEAREAADVLVAEFTLGIISKPTKIKRVCDAAEKFRARQEERIGEGNNKISKSHFDDVQRSMKFCLTIKFDGKPFGNWDFANLICDENAEELSDAFVAAIECESKLKDGKKVKVSQSTNEKRIKALKSFLNYCQVKRWCRFNPMDKVSLGSSEALSDRAPKIQPEIIQQLRSAGLDGETLISRAMVETALGSGIRQGELRALTWADVDFEEEEIDINKAVKHGKGLVIGDPKTKRGFRQVGIPTQTVQILRELKVKTKYSRDSDFVFASAAGLPKQKKTLRALIERASARAGVERMVWGDMRHFFASVQLSALGEDWPEVAALMGHSNSHFTYKQYGHYVKNKKKQSKSRDAVSQAIYGS